MHDTAFSMKYGGIGEPPWSIHPEKVVFSSENNSGVVTENRKMVFHQKIFVLEFNPTMPFKEKQRWRKKVTEHGGTISYIVSRKVTFVVLFNEMLEKNTFKVKQARQHGIPVLRSEFIDDSLQKQQLMSVGVYYAGEAMDGKDFKKGKITAVQKQRLTKRRRKQVILNNLECWPLGDPDAPSFDEEMSKLAKWALLKMKTDVQVIEVHASVDSRNNKYRIYSQSGSLDTEQNLKAVEGAVVWFVDTSEEAVSAYEQLYKRYTTSPYSMTPWTNPTFSSNNLGSVKFRLILGELCNLSTELTPEVGGLVELLWTEATSEAAKQINMDLRHIKLEKVEDAEAALLQLKEATQDSADNNKLCSLLEDFYSAMPHKADHRKDRLSIKEISAKLDLCQLVHDIIDVSEATDWSESATTYAKFRALRCHVTCLEQSAEEYLAIKEMISSTSSNIEIQNIFRVGRTIEDVDFRSDIGNVHLLMHSSATHNFLGILSRGLLLPKLAEGEHGISRTDQGFLGRGIYFSDSASKCAEYSQPSLKFGCRLLLFCDVALGNICDYTKIDTTLRAPPSGYDSVHGVKRSSSNLNSQFQDDEFVIYDPRQQKVRYVVEFHLSGDNINPLSSITQRLEDDTNSEEEVVQKNLANIDISDVKDLPDPLQKISAGLISGAKKSVPLKSVHIRAKLLDMVAQVVVMQKYRNDNNDPIEAKYVFPLDDTAAVCGFEAFINDKHIIGKVKEKSTAHKEYKEAISKGHGAYLMDEEEPDVFTVSVGNLPPQSDVLIKITYIAELQVEGESIAFRIPATVAPWVRDTALAQQTQSSLDTLKIEDRDRSSISLQVAVDMPFDIRKVSSPTHQVKFKKTAAKAVVELPKNSHLDDGFILLVTLAEVHVPRMWVERHPDRDSQACMLAFYPEFEALTDDEQEVIFLLDMSNSMKGQSARDAKKVMLLALEYLPDKSIFNIVIFGTSYIELFPAPQRRNKQNLNKAVQFVQDTLPNLGGSNALSPADCLFLLSPPEGSRSIFFISDGYIPNSESLISSVQTGVVRNRVFTLGIGGNVNHHLMRTLASRGGGTYQHYNYKTRSTWQHRMKSQVDKACQPGISGVEVEWCQHSDNVPAPKQAPQNIPSLFNGSRLVVYGFADNCTQVKLKAVVDGMEISTMVSTTELNMTSGTILHQLTARAMIRDYEDGILSEDKIQQRILKLERKREIIDLSTEYSIVTPYTSFVAVEERDQDEEKVDGPSLEELVSKETVDILPYIGWQNPDMFDDKDPVTIVEELLRKGAIAENFSQMEAQRCYVSILDYIPELKKSENIDLKEKVLDEVSRFCTHTDTEQNRTVLEKFKSSLPRERRQILDYDGVLHKKRKKRFRKVLENEELLSDLDLNTAYYDPKTRSMKAGFVQNKYFPPDFDSTSSFRKLQTFGRCQEKRKPAVTEALGGDMLEAGSHHGNSPMDLDTDESQTEFEKSLIEEFGNSWENIIDDEIELVMEHFDEVVCDQVLGSESTVSHAPGQQVPQKVLGISGPIFDFIDDDLNKDSVKESFIPTERRRSTAFKVPRKQVATKAARISGSLNGLIDDDLDEEGSVPFEEKRSTVFHAPQKQLATKAARKSMPPAGTDHLTDDSDEESDEEDSPQSGEKRSTVFHAPRKQLATKAARKSAPPTGIDHLTDDDSDEESDEEDLPQSGEERSTVFHAPQKQLATKAIRIASPPFTFSKLRNEDSNDDSSEDSNKESSFPSKEKRLTSFYTPKKQIARKAGGKSGPVADDSDSDSDVNINQNVEKYEGRDNDNSKQNSHKNNRPVISPNRDDPFCVPHSPYIPTSATSIPTASFVNSGPEIEKLSAQKEFLATRDFTSWSELQHSQPTDTLARFTEVQPSSTSYAGFGFGAPPITTAADTMAGFGFGAPPITTATDTMAGFGFGAPPITTATDTMAGFGFGAPPIITATDTMAGFGFGAPPITTATDTMAGFGFGAPPITTATDTLAGFGIGVPPITTATNDMAWFGIRAPPITTATGIMAGFGFGAPPITTATDTMAGFGIGALPTATDITAYNTGFLDLAQYTADSAYVSQAPFYKSNTQQVQQSAANKYLPVLPSVIPTEPCYGSFSPCNSFATVRTLASTKTSQPPGCYRGVNRNRGMGGGVGRGRGRGNLLSAKKDTIMIEGITRKRRLRSRDRGKSRSRERSSRDRERSSRDRERSRSRDRERSRSRDRERLKRGRSRSRSRGRSRSRDRERSKRGRSRSRSRERSRSRDRERSKRGRSRSRSRGRSRSRDRERSKRGRSRSRSRGRSRSRDKRRSRSTVREKSKSRDRQRSRSQEKTVTHRFFNSHRSCGRDLSPERRLKTTNVRPIKTYRRIRLLRRSSSQSPARRLSQFSTSKSQRAGKRLSPFSRSRSWSVGRRWSTFSKSRKVSPKRRNPFSSSSIPSSRRRRSRFSRSRSTSPRRRRSSFSRSRSSSPRRRQRPFSRSRSPSPRKTWRPFSRSRSASPRRQSPFSRSRSLSPRRQSQFSRSRSPRRRLRPFSRSRSPSPRRRSPLSRSRSPSSRRWSPFSRSSSPSPRRRRSPFSRSRSPSPRRERSPFSRSRSPSPRRRSPLSRSRSLSPRRIRPFSGSSSPSSRRRSPFSRSRSLSPRRRSPFSRSRSLSPRRRSPFSRSRSSSLRRRPFSRSSSPSPRRRQSKHKEQVKKHGEQSKRQEGKKRKLAVLRYDTEYDILQMVCGSDDKPEANQEEPGEAGIWTGIRFKKIEDVFKVVPEDSVVPEYWELCPELCENLGLSYEKITEILRRQGLYSLGASVSKTVERFLMTLLVVMMIVIKKVEENSNIDLHKEISEATFKDFSLSYFSSDGIDLSITGPHTEPWHALFCSVHYKMPFQWLMNVMTQHPTLYRDLELGRNKKDFLWNLFRAL